MPKILSYNSSSQEGKKSDKQNFFISIWGLFKSQNRFAKFSLLTLLLIIVATPFIASNLLETRQRAESFVSHNSPPLVEQQEEEPGCVLPGWYQGQPYTGDISKCVTNTSQYIWDPDDNYIGGGADTSYTNYLYADWMDHLVGVIACGPTRDPIELSIRFDPPGWELKSSEYNFDSGTRNVSCIKMCAATPQYDRYANRTAWPYQTIPNQGGGGEVLGQAVPTAVNLSVRGLDGSVKDTGITYQISIVNSIEINKYCTSPFLDDSGHFIANRVGDGINYPRINWASGVASSGLSPTPALVPSPTFVPITQPAGSDNQPPTISITAPVNGAIVARNSQITIQANATDNVAVAKVEFLVNGALICIDTTTPYSCNWKTSGKPNANFTISAKAYDLSNNAAINAVNVKTAK